MKEFLYAITLLWIIVGACFILYTPETRRISEKILKALDRRFLALVPAVVGILLIVAATQTRNVWFVRFLGVIALAKGGFVFFNPKELYDELSRWYLESASDQTYRFFGIVSLILATAVMSWIL
jgi:hypothetical protein